MAELKYPIALGPKVAREFVDLMAKYTDSPPAYLMGAVLSVIATIGGQFVKVRGIIPINDYFLLVGKSGVTRKTTAQRWAEKFIQLVIDSNSQLKKEITVGGDKPPKRFNPFYYVTNFSVEGLENTFGGAGTSILLTPGEYKQVFSIANRQGQSNTIPQLTSMYDGKPIRTRLRNLSLDIANYSQSLLGCSTKGWLKEALSNENIIGGFVNRHNVILCEPTETPVVFPSEPPEEEIMKIVDQLAQLVPNFVFTEENGLPHWRTEQKNIDFKDDGTKAVFEEYFLTITKQQRESDEVVADILAREWVHCLKLAGLKAFADGTNAIDTDCVFFGIEWAKASSSALLELVTNKGLSEDALKLNAFIVNIWNKDKCFVTLTHISKRYGGKQARWHKALSELIDSGLVIESEGMYTPAPNTLSSASPSSSA